MSIVWIECSCHWAGAGISMSAMNSWTREKKTIWITRNKIVGVIRSALSQTISDNKNRKHEISASTANNNSIWTEKLYLLLYEPYNILFKSANIANPWLLFGGRHKFCAYLRFGLCVFRLPIYFFFILLSILDHHYIMLLCISTSNVAMYILPLCHSHEVAQNADK